jgi:hypothetical protein
MHSKLAAPISHLDDKRFPATFRFGSDDDLFGIAVASCCAAKQWLSIERLQGTQCDEGGGKVPWRRAWLIRNLYL